MITASAEPMNPNDRAVFISLASSLELCLIRTVNRDPGRHSRWQRLCLEYGSGVHLAVDLSSGLELGLELASASQMS